MILGFTKKKIMSIILLLGCIFISLAMSHIPFLVSNQKAGINMEGLSNEEDDEDKEDTEENKDSKDEPKVPPTKICIPPPVVPDKYLMNIKKHKEFSNNYKTYLKCINI